MAVDLQTILGVKQLTTTINNVAGGVPNRLPPGFLTTTRPVEGDQATYMKIDNTRKTARQQSYGGPPKPADQVGRTEVPVKLIHSLEDQNHKPHTLLNLLDDNGAKQAMGAAEVGRQTGEFARRFQNLRLGAIYSMLTLGLIYFDADGDLLPSSSGAVISIDFSVPAANQNQAGGIIGTTWATDSVDIVGDVIALKEAALKATGLMPVHALYGANIPEYLFSNTVLNAMISRNASLNAVAAQGVVPPILGMQWWDMTGAFYEDADGTNRDFWGGDALVLIPEVSRDWYELLEGSLPVATALGNVGGEATDMLTDIELITGMFSLATVGQAAPATINQIAGDTFLPTLMNGAAIYILDVVP